MICILIKPSSILCLKQQAKKEWSILCLKQQAKKEWKVSNEQRRLYL